MSIELPRDAEGREIPLDTVVLFGGNGNAYNIVRWIFTADFETWSESNSWRAITEKHRAIDPELMYLTPPDTWEKLEEDLKRAANSTTYECCAYLGGNGTECASCEANDENTCEKFVMENIASRIRKLRGED